MFGASKGHAPKSAACSTSGNPLPQVQQSAAGAPTQQRHCAATPVATASSRIGTSSYEVGHPLRLKPSSAPNHAAKSMGGLTGGALAGSPGRKVRLRTVAGGPFRAPQRVLESIAHLRVEGLELVAARLDGCQQLLAVHVEEASGGLHVEGRDALAHVPAEREELDGLRGPVHLQVHEDLLDAPQSGEVRGPRNDQQAVAPREEDGQAHQAGLDVVLVDAVLVDPQPRLPLVLPLELAAPRLQRVPLRLRGVVPAVAKEGVDVLKAAGGRVRLQGGVWCGALHVGPRDFV
mmetsp:Transcript_38370/g.99124  ORF Transcript_38370/g.99124 Transcript_38370/m.99124 type:complete len:290 (+) Transcript_38370:3-872(+)